MDFVAYAPVERLSGPGQWAGFINAEASVAGVPPCALAAIVQRESQGRNIFQEGVPPGPGCGVGLTQITYNVDWSDPQRPVWVTPSGTRLELLDPAQNLLCSAKFFLRPAIDLMLNLRNLYGAEMSAFSSEVLYFAFAAYNAGGDQVESAIVRGVDPDTITTDNYASGTLAIYHTLLAESHGNP